MLKEKLFKIKIRHKIKISQILNNYNVRGFSDYGKMNRMTFL